MSVELFRRFLNGLPQRGGYCMDCLSELWGEAATTIRSYLDVSPAITGRPDHCRNCGEHMETFRADPAL